MSQNTVQTFAFHRSYKICITLIFVCEADLFILMLYISQLVSQLVHKAFLKL